MKRYVYMLQCADGTLYTGITTDVTRRLAEHNASQLGAKYTKARRPVQLIGYEEFSDRSQATKREMEIKKMTRVQKMEVFI